MVLTAEAIFGNGIVVWAVVLAVLGFALLWRQADEAQRARWLDQSERLNPVRAVFGSGGWAAYLLIAAALACGLFEWRVRGENKPLIRLAALGTAALGLMVLVWLTAAALLIPFCLGAPATGKLAREVAEERVGRVDTETDALEKG